MEIFEIPFAAEDIDLLAYGIGHLAEPGVEDVDNRLAGILDEAFFEAFLTAFEETFLETFLETFFKGEFFEECDVGHGCVGEA